MCIREQSLCRGPSQSAVRRRWLIFVQCDHRIHNDRASRSANLNQCACPFYSSREGYFDKTSHHPGLSAPLQRRFVSLRLLVFPNAKIALESEEIGECDGHTVHKLSQRRLTADWLHPRESDCSWTRSKVSADWLPSYIKATRPVLEIFKMAGYFPDRPRIYCSPRETLKWRVHGSEREGIASGFWLINRSCRLEINLASKVCILIRAETLHKAIYCSIFWSYS